MTTTSVSYADPNDPRGTPCDPLDPECELTIDVLFIYTSSFSQLLDHDARRVDLAVNQMMYEANLTLEQSVIPSPYRYRIAGVEELGYQERGSLKSDVIALRFDPRFQALKASTGADFVFMILS